VVICAMRRSIAAPRWRCSGDRRSWGRGVVA
jgi:hypothetical protein